MTSTAISPALHLSLNLNSDLHLRPTTNKDGGLIEWFEQAGAQHDHDFYLSLLQQQQRVSPGAE